MNQTEDFFRSRLDQMIDLRHPLAVLSSHMPWQEIEASLSHRFARQVRAGKKLEDVDLFWFKQHGGGRWRESCWSPQVAAAVDGFAAVFEARV